MFQKPYIKTLPHFTVIVYRQLSASKLLSSVGTCAGDGFSFTFPSSCLARTGCKLVISL